MLILISTNILDIVLDLIEKDFSFSKGSGRNVIILGADMSSSVHATNKTQNILIVGKDFT